MPKDVLAAAHSKSAMDRLRRVADALGVPAASFIERVPGDPHLAGAAELLRLWTELREQDDRDALLATARDLASRYDVESAAAG